jgi:soluble lytic murein transglycosylase-like protein
VTWAAWIFCLFAPAQVVGDGFQFRAATQLQVIKVRTLLERQPLKLSEIKLQALAQSIVEESSRHALDATLLLAIIHVESRFDPRAVSSRGAQGLMQIRPVAVAALREDRRVPHSPTDPDLKDPVLNVQLGASYLGLLKAMFGDLKTSLAAYHQGPTRVRNKIAARENISFAYAEKVLSVQRVFEGMTASGGAA